MNRTSRQKREHRRAALLGVLLSVLLHAAVLALGRIEVASLPVESRVIATFDEAPPDAWRPLEVVALQPVMRAEGAEGATAAFAAAGGATPTAAHEPHAGAALLPASPEPEGETFNALVVVDPLTNVQTEPVAITDLPVAETLAPAPAESAEPAYQPGSVGKAKRQWAKAGEGAAEEGRVRVFVGTGGGHCPMPGRGRGLGPWW